MNEVNVPPIMELPPVLRLLLVSSKAKFASQLETASKWNVKTIVYQYENNSLEDIVNSIYSHLGNDKVGSIGLIYHGTENEIFLCSVGHEVLNTSSITESQSVRDFFIKVAQYLDRDIGPQVHILACPFSSQISEKMRPILADIMKCPVTISHDLNGNDALMLSVYNSKHKEVPIGELYFCQDKLKDIMQSSIGTLQRSRMQNLSDYEKIKIVGKGAFGTAVLYRKKDDDSLVILKEINMHDLTSSERQLAMNEVKVLSMLDHPNIVSYYDSFEQDGVLMIEMEYADGGTLAQFLANRKKPLEEEEVLFYFHQIVAAICYMHEHHILHRDLKTANIFLTKENCVKVGDFGISKMLTTRQGGANTVVGTPYYISPEMCEGKAYNQKSDIWALGCILYEMACRHKTFEGSNLPALVNKIVKGHFAPVKGSYSPGFKQLIRDLLQKDPDFRPTAHEILYQKVPELEKQFQIEHPNDEEEDSMEYTKQSSHCKSSLKHLRSVLYHVIMCEMNISLTPVPLPPRSRIREVAVSPTHMIALTYDLLAYTWGDGRKGQLGHGIKENWRSKPTCVESLKGKNISRVCAGDGFSVFASDNGIVMTCGDGALGCLGRGDWNCCTKPKLIEKLLSVDVSAINCGPQHIVVITGEGGAFAWGCGSGGRLGTGTEEDCCTPTEVQLSDHVVLQQVFCGLDGTMFITESKGVLACGRNDWNKLGLNERSGFLMQMKQLMVKTEVEKCLTPKRLRWLQNRVISVSMGASHTAILVEPGRVITMGCNQEGQLGRGNARTHTTPMLLKSMMNKTVTMIQCGSTFTVAGTAENVVYFWGGRRILSSPFRPLIDASSLKDPVMQSVKMFDLKPKTKKNTDIEEDEPSLISETSVSDIIKIGENNSPLMQEVERIGPDSPIIQVKTPETKLMSSNASSVFSNRSSDRDSPDRNTPDSVSDKKNLVLNPEEILALYASPTQIARGEIVHLSNIYCYGHQLYLAVDTTAPLPQSRKKKAVPKPISPKSKAPDVNLGSSVEDFLIESPPSHKNTPPASAPCSLESSQVDSMGPIPQWLKEELEDAIIPGAAPADTTANDSSVKGLATVHEVFQNVSDAGKSAGSSAVISRSKLSQPATLQQSKLAPKPRKKSLIPIRCNSAVTIASHTAVSPSPLRPRSSHKASSRPVSAYCPLHMLRPGLTSLTHSYPQRHHASAHHSLVKGKCVSSSSPDILCCEPSYPKRPQSSSISESPYETTKGFAHNLSCSCSGHEFVDNSVSAQQSSCESIVTCIPTNPMKARELELENKIKDMDERSKQKEVELSVLQKEFEKQAQLIKEIEDKAMQQAKEKEAFEAEVAKVREELSKKNQAFQECQRQLQRLQDQFQDLKQNVVRSPDWISEPLPLKKRKAKSKICSVQ